MSTCRILYKFINHEKFNFFIDCGLTACYIPLTDYSLSRLFILFFVKSSYFVNSRKEVSIGKTAVDSSANTK